MDIDRVVEFRLAGQPGRLLVLLRHIASPHVLHCTGAVRGELVEDGRPDQGHEQSRPDDQRGEEGRPHTVDGHLLHRVSLHI